MVRLVALIALLLALPSFPAFAQVVAVPNSMNFQGRLSKPDGTPVPDGNYALTLRLFDAFIGGNQKFSQTYANVRVRNGTFALPLSGFAAGTFEGSLYLEIVLGNEPPQTPRQVLVTVPYAFKADLARTIPDGSVTLGKLAPGTLNFSNISGTLNGNQITSGSLYLSLFNEEFRQLFDPFSFSRSLVRVGSAATNNYPISVAQRNSTLYVVNRDSDTLQIFDLSNPTAPTLTGSIATAQLPTQVKISNFYALVVCRNAFQIFNIANPAAPVLLATVNVLGVQSIDAEGGNLLITVNNNTLLRYNIANLPSITFLDSAATESNPVDVRAVNGRAYVVNFASSSLQVFEYGLGTLGFKGRITTEGGPTSTEVLGNLAYVANSNSNSVTVYNVSNPAAPTFFLTHPTAAGPYHLSTDGSFLAVACSSGNRVQVFDVRSGGFFFTSEVATRGSARSSAIWQNTVSVVNAGINLADVHQFNTLALNANLHVYGHLTAPSARIPQLTGNIGVNNANPAYALDVSGRIRLRPGGTGEFDTAGIWFSDATDALRSFIGRRDDASSGFYGTAVNQWVFTVQDTGNANLVGTLTQSSDARLKKNVVPLDNALAAILNLRGVKYEWNEPMREKGRQIGFLAQEVEDILPELVATDARGYKSVAYANLVPVLVEAVKTLKKQSDGKEKRLRQVEAENAELKAALAEVLKRLERIETHQPR